MQTLLLHFIEKLRRLKYVNRGVVFLFDLVFSVGGTALSYIYVFNIFGKNQLHTSVGFLLLCSALISTIVFISTGLYKVIVRHSTLQELPKIFVILCAKELLMALVVYYFELISSDMIVFCAVLDILFTSFLMIGIRACIITVYYSVVNIDSEQQDNTLIYSPEGSGPLLADQINKNIYVPYVVKGFLTSNKKKVGMRIAGVRVYFLDRNEEKLDELFVKLNISCLIFTSNEHFNRESDRLVEFCIARRIKMFMAGELQAMDGAKSIHNKIKPIQIEDLLDRQEIIIETDKISDELEGKVVLVSGAAGSIGREIAMQLALFNVEKLVLVDNAETPLHNIQLEFEKSFPKVKVVFCLGDVRSKERIGSIFDKHKPNVVFHAAAYKHVPMIESNPCEAVVVNVWGTVNLAKHAVEYGVDKFVMISTDKAVNPTNVMGASKRIAEMCVQNLNGRHQTKFIITRFGNVLGSNGSVIPHFKEQIAAGGPVTVTHPDIIRYFMTIAEACRLVLQAELMGHGGEIFVFDIGEQVKIADLARKMISLSGFEPDKDIKIEYTGLRPGEKLYEELLSDKEKTDATSHLKIRMTPSCISCGSLFDQDIRSLILASQRIEVEKTIIKMKQIIPEFISNNSVFEIYDNNNVR